MRLVNNFTPLVLCCLLNLHNPLGTVHYTITRLHGDESRSRERFFEAKERQFRAYLLPSGVPLEKIEEFWKALNFGGKSKEEMDKLIMPSADNFEDAYEMVEELRSLARAGKRESDRQAKAEAGKEKVVWTPTWPRTNKESDELATLVSQQRKEEPGDHTDNGFTSDVAREIPETGQETLSPETLSLDVSASFNASLINEARDVLDEEEDIVLQSDAPTEAPDSTEPLSSTLDVEEPQSFTSSSTVELADSIYQVDGTSDPAGLGDSGFSAITSENTEEATESECDSVASDTKLKEDP